MAIQFPVMILQAIPSKFVINKQLWTALKEEADFMLQDTGELKWYNVAFAK